MMLSDTILKQTTIEMVDINITKTDQQLLQLYEIIWYDKKKN